MIGKFLNGALVGGVLAAAGLAAASLIAPQRASLPEPMAGGSGAITPEPAVTETAALPEPVALPEPDLEPEPELEPEPAVADAPAEPAEPAAPAVNVDIAAEAPAPQSDPAESANAPAADTDAVAASTSGALAALPAADAALPAADPVPRQADPVPASVSDAPQEPAATGTDRSPAAPMIAELPAPRLPAGPIQPPAPQEDVVVAAVEAPPPAPVDEPLLPDTGDAALEPVLPEVSDPAPAAPDPLPAPDVAILPEAAPPGMPGRQPRALPGSTPEPAPAETEVAILPDAEAAPSATFKPAPGLAGRTEGVIIGRLPRIGDAPAAEPVAEAVLPDAGPLQQFARSFDNPDAKPVFAIVLVDTGEADLDRRMLANLPFPATFAINPMAPDAAERAAIYRAAGQEVIMLATGIAEGSTASDVEVAFQSMAQGLPESVAVMDGADLRFQGDRPLASLVVPVIAAQGRGLLTWDQGLNAANQVARRVDLAAAVVFRNLDGAGEDRTAIRRSLDRAVFKAGQDGRVTVVGQTLPETIAALLEWTVGDRAATVALAPVSAALTVE